MRSVSLPVPFKGSATWLCKCVWSGWRKRKNPASSLGCCGRRVSVFLGTYFWVHIIFGYNISNAKWSDRYVPLFPMLYQTEVYLCRTTTTFFLDFEDIRVWYLAEIASYQLTLIKNMRVQKWRYDIRRCKTYAG